MARGKGHGGWGAARGSDPFGTADSARVAIRTAIDRVDPAAREHLTAAWHPQGLVWVSYDDAGEIDAALDALKTVIGGRGVLLNEFNAPWDDAEVVDFVLEQVASLRAYREHLDEDELRDELEQQFESGALRGVEVRDLDEMRTDTLQMPLRGWQHVEV